MANQPVVPVTAAAVEKSCFRARLANWKRGFVSVLCEARVLPALLSHPRVPWRAKAVAGCAAAYVVSPVQLIPTFIPVIGQLDDLTVIYFGMKIIRKFTPPTVLEECEARSTFTDLFRRRRHTRSVADRPASYTPNMAHPVSSDSSL